MLRKEDLETPVDSEIEKFCRLMCREEDVDPDDFGVGMGHGVEKDLEFRLWQYWIPHAITILSDDNKQ